MIVNLLSLVLNFGVLAPGPAWSAKVGEYRLEKWVNQNGDRHTMYLKDRRGRVVTTLSDYHVGLIDDLWSEHQARTFDLNRDGVPEVIFETWSGGAHGSSRYFIWSLGSQPQCLLAYDKNNVSGRRDFELIDLDGDGVKEIRSWYDGFAYMAGASFWGNLPVVLKLDGGKYVDRTRQFNGVLMKAEHAEWVALASTDRNVSPDSWIGSSADAINLIALGEMSSHRTRTWRRLVKELPKRNLVWLKKREPAILRIIRGRTKRYAYPQPYEPRPFAFVHFPTERDWLR